MTAVWRLGRGERMGSKVLVLVGQIASGKTTLARYLEKSGFERIVTWTTRPPRDGEEDGRDYYFLGTEAFLSMVGNGYFAESTDYHADFGHVYYGTSRKSLETPSDVRKVIVLNPKGVMALKDTGYDIFVVHLDFDQETLMRRALARGDKPIEIGRRIAEDERLFDDLRYGDGYVDLRITDPDLSTEQIARMICEAM